MRIHRAYRNIATLFPILILLWASGCAQLPPNQNGLSGVRLRVTMTFRGDINPNYAYFFLINNTSTATKLEGDPNAPGPVAIFLPPYGNGFARSSNNDASSIGFTDYIRFDQTGYRLWYVSGNAQSGFSYLPANQSPISSVLPGQNGELTNKQLQFEIDLSQLLRQANGAPLTDQTQAITIARAIRYLQVNIVATSNVPTDLTTLREKQVESLGDTRDSTSRSSFLLLDVSGSNPLVSNNNVLNSLIKEPAENDVVDLGSNRIGGGDPSLDIVDWSIEVRRP